MPSVPSSPRTPTRPRKSSSVDLSFASQSPRKDGRSSRRSSTARKNSQASIETPSTPWLQPNLGAEEEGLRSNRHNPDTILETRGADGIGNLADELAEAWEEEEEEQGDAGDSLAAQLDKAQVESNGVLDGSDLSPVKGLTASKQNSPIKNAGSTVSLSPSKSMARPKHRRQDSQYESSDYGEPGDDEDGEVFPTSLQSRLAAIESLARRGLHANGSETDDVVKNFASSLRDLPSQTGVENCTTRLMTSHTAILSHLTHQSRTLHSLTHPLISPLSFPPDPAIIDHLVPLLSDLIYALPNPASQCLSSLHNFAIATSDLQATLTYVSDTIYMNRQTAMQASRKLKSASDLATELRQEADAREEGVEWIEKGRWDERLARRECARVCGEVVDGFEDVCNDWRMRLEGAAAVDVAVA